MKLAAPALQGAVLAAASVLLWALRSKTLLTQARQNNDKSKGRCPSRCHLNISLMLCSCPPLATVGWTQ